MAKVSRSVNLNERTPKPNATALANWALTRIRSSEDIRALQVWIANDANKEELGAFLSRSPALLHSLTEYATRRQFLSADQVDTVFKAAAAERHCELALSLFMAVDATDYPTHEAWENLPRIDCAVATSGAIAAFWACQVALAASIERAIMRLDLPRGLLELKQRHSARAARCLMEWARVSETNVDAFPESHRIASGINAMVDRYCSGHVVHPRLARTPVHPHRSLCVGETSAHL
jgi:hypothetical protein